MNEFEVRERLRRAIGETDPPPGMEAAIEARLMQAKPREHPRGLGRLAAVLALVLVAALLTPVLVARYAAWAARSVPAVKATPSPTPVATGAPSPIPAAIDATSCRLPVLALREAGPPAQTDTQVGFVDTKTGVFTQDATASVAVLPGGGSAGTLYKSSQPSAPSQYSPEFHRWLPVAGRYVAPDGRSYVWEKLLPDGSGYDSFTGSELHVYDLAAAQDRVLWSYPGSINVVWWDARGILATAGPARGGAATFWLIDPSSGATTQQTASADPRLPTVLPGDATATGVVGYSSVGQDALGHGLFRIGSRAAGDREWIFVETAPGIRVTVYQGTQGDATAFDPYGAFGDATGIWFGDRDQAAIWHWEAAAGLRKIAVRGLPPPLIGSNSHVNVLAAGPCV